MMSWQTFPAWISRVTTTAGCVALALGVGACQSAGTPTTHDPSFPTRETVQPTRRDYKRVYLTQPGGAETDRHVGYVAREFLEFDRVEKTITTVYDPSFTAVGFYFDDGGATYVYVSNQDSKFLGNHTEQRSLALLYEEDGIFRFSEELE